VAGLYVLAFVLLFGVGAYARAMLAVHAAQYATLNVVVPLLLALGAPLTLAAQALSPSSQYGQASQALLGSGLAHRIGHPAIAAGIYCLPYPLLYLTGWL
jgi:putative copper resistance protein D